MEYTYNDLSEIGYSTVEINKIFKIKTLTLNTLKKISEIDSKSRSYLFDWILDNKPKSTLITMAINGFKGGINPISILLKQNLTTEQQKYLITSKIKNIATYLDETYTSYDMKLALKYEKKGYSVKHLLKKDFNDVQIEVLMDLPEEIANKFTKDMSCNVMKIFINAIDEGLDVFDFTKTLSKEQLDSTNFVDTFVSEKVLNNIDLTMFLPLKLSANKMQFLAKTIPNIKCPEKLLTLDLKQSNAKLTELIKILDEGNDVNLFLKYDNTKTLSQMYNIYKKDKVLFEIVNDKSFKVTFIDAIMECYKMLEEKEKESYIKEVINPNFSKEKMGSICKLIINNKDYKIIKNNNFTDKQIIYLRNKLLEDKDISNIAHPSISVNDMKSILSLQDKGFNINTEAYIKEHSTEVAKTEEECDFYSSYGKYKSISYYNKNYPNDIFYLDIDDF